MQIFVFFVDSMIVKNLFKFPAHKKADIPPIFPLPVCRSRSGFLPADKRFAKK